MTEAQNGMRDFDYSLMYKRERRRALEKRCSRQEVQYMQSQRKRKTRMKQLTTTGKVWRIMMSNEVGVRIRPQRARQILLKGSNSILKAYLYSPEKQTHKGVYTVDLWITQVWILWVHLHAVFFFSNSKYCSIHDCLHLQMWKIQRNHIYVGLPTIFIQNYKAIYYEAIDKWNRIKLWSPGSPNKTHTKCFKLHIYKITNVSIFILFWSWWKKSLS